MIPMRSFQAFERSSPQLCERIGTDGHAQIRNARSLVTADLIRAFHVLFLISLLACTMQSAHATPNPTEDRLITGLITRVAAMKNIVFIRNGDEHDATEAAKHLQDKYDYFKADIKTADDFIRLCATRSEMTGKPYQVKMANGNLIDSADFMTDQLIKMRHQTHN